MSEPPDHRDNYCYRHPDRQSFVLCQRCGRTICGQCQTPGAVGVICPECMKAQRKAAPRTKPRIVAQVRSGEHPIMTYAIIAVTLFVFILQQVPGFGVTGALRYAGVYSVPGWGNFEPWRMLTTVLVHASIIHVGLNMFTLWIFGRLLEPILGRGRLLTLYLISAFAGSLGVYLLASPLQPVVGASGAIFGLVGGFFVIARHLRANTTGLLILVVVNFVIDFLPGMHIAWQAHIGGLIGGAIIGLIFIFTRTQKRRKWQIPLLALFCVLMIGTMLVIVPPLPVG